ncbi:MAG TPA: PH domain-containing protein [Candidatus Saccharimonadales bacterium]|nr:PH domain-containing protein [Candidatus Saccharimonadales bacterium]
MVSKKSVQEQLKKLDFKPHGWGKAEVGELHNILLPDEEIYDLVNGIYEGGFALLVATDIRVLLIDKKPLNFLTVEDLRFDQINELDYSHRLLGANITIASGSKTMKFRSYNQQRLRKVINHVQHCMAELKKKQSSHQEDQKVHLEQINQQLQAYLIAQHQQQEQLRQQLHQVNSGMSPAAPPDPLKPSPELADFLYAQGLLAQYREQHGDMPAPVVTAPQDFTTELPSQPAIPNNPSATSQLQELYAEGTQEIFGKRSPATNAVTTSSDDQDDPKIDANTGVEINPLKIAKAKLPMALRNRKFGRPSFHAHSQAQPTTEPAAIR